MKSVIQNYATDTENNPSLRNLHFQGNFIRKVHNIKESSTDPPSTWQTSATTPLSNK